MNEDIKISIIMPSYNVANYIEECIESVINQTLKEIEIICVDAGSEDGTLEILQRYAEKDNRIILLNSDKKSYGYQMNLGLSVAKGDYIGIVETDDYIDSNMFSDLYNLSEEGSIDIVKSNFYHLIGITPEEQEIIVDGTKINVPKVKFNVFENSNIMYGHPSIWAAIYRTEFLMKNNIKFMEEPGGGWVDNPFYFETFLNAKSIKYTKKPYYYYRQSNPDSSSNNLSDLTLPFRRMLNNIDIVEANYCKNENILVALYTIIFWHLNDIIAREEYIKDKENVDKYIHEVINKMDGRIVAKRFDKDKQDLFLELLNQENPNKKISIIMPLYNAEDVLDVSIKSVEKQTLKDIELICVDDGSTDNTLNLLKDYEKKYDFVRVFTQENQGFGKASNNGINYSHGEYIGFLDANDFFVDSNALEQLYNLAKFNNAAIVSGNILNEDEKRVHFSSMEYFTEDKIILPEEYGIPLSFYKSIFKKDFLESNEIRFPDLISGQGPVFLSQLLNKVEKIYCVATDYVHVHSDVNECNSYKELYDQLLHFKLVFDNLKEVRFENIRMEVRKALFSFISYLNDDILTFFIPSIEEIFSDNQIFLNDLKSYFYLKFRNNKSISKDLISSKPKISVVIPMTDNIELIKETVEILEKQSLNQLEFIFVDNNSEEKTINSLKDLIKEDSRFKLLEIDNIALESALETGYNESVSEWVLFLDMEKKIVNESFIENLFESILINDKGFLYSKDNLINFYNGHDLVRNIDSEYYDSNVILDSKKNLILNPKISVIIPVYNAEEFLNESIPSLLNQSFKQIELVCVNDGSKDNSLKMLNEFARNDPRVIVIDQENGGCGAARNKSLENARGEYIYFFDPDDYILPNTFEELYKNAVINETELVMFKIARFRDGEDIDYSIPGFPFENVFKGVDFNNFSFNYKDIKPYVLNASFAPWTKLYKKSFLDKYGDFKFPTDVAFDDTPFHVFSLLRAESISYVPKFFYHYRLSNPNSVNNTASNGIDIFKICDIIENFLINNGFMYEFKDEFDFFKITQVLNYILSTNTEEYFNKAKNEFLKISLSENHLIDDYKYERYILVLKSNNFNEYLRAHYDLEINNLKNKNNSLSNTNMKLEGKNKKLVRSNKKLKKEIKDLKDFKNNVLTSNSWKLTSYIRKVRSLNKKY